MKDDARKHTAVISNPTEMWCKLAWDVDVFRDIQTRFPKENQPLAYAAINVCIAANCLRNWAIAFFKRKSEQAGEPWDKSGFIAMVNADIPELSACVDIANTAKHSNFKEAHWTGGQVCLEWEKAYEGNPPGYVLYHVNSGSHGKGMALGQFDSLLINWRKFLTTHGFIDEKFNMPEWQTNKLVDVFGDPSDTRS
ncbi:hypothetical protein [Aestuariispira ectoiniformans]|uniref:hypothetical protein n=1 Tax=Aestuariispira ectoiniformans TaxID=2775080 RepID=UPI00223BDC05|nr:hypothetical protein [Aestuariispira ectoiniformans]